MTSYQPMFQSVLSGENHLDMPGWEQYLHRQLHELNISHLSIACFTPKRGAWTPGFEISERQIRDLERIHKGQLRPPSNCIDLAQNTYKLDRKGAKLGKNILHARRILSSEEEHVWISFGGGYVVVGVSELDMGASDRCSSGVLAIQNHILASLPQRVTSQQSNEQQKSSGSVRGPPSAGALNFEPRDIWRSTESLASVRSADSLASGRGFEPFASRRSFESRLNNIPETEMQLMPQRRGDLTHFRYDEDD